MQKLCHTGECGRKPEPEEKTQNGMYTELSVIIIVGTNIIRPWCLGSWNEIMEYMPYRHNTDKLQVHTCGACKMLPAYYFCEGPQLFVVQKFLDHPTKPAGLGTGLRVQIILADLSLEAACKGGGIATVASLPLFLPSSKMQHVS